MRYRSNINFSSVLGLMIVGMLFGIVATALVGLIAAIPLFFLWNWLMPSIFGITSISYWQAWGLVWLASILFKASASVKKGD